MWYVMQVQPRHEYEIARWCSEFVAKPEEEIFVIQGTRFFQHSGVWERRLSIAFHGYVFADTEEIADFKQRLKKIPAMTKLLGTGSEVVPVNEEEKELLLRLGGEDHVIELSKGYRKNDRLVVTEGPMMGLEGLVKWTDRHKRIACLEIMIMGQPTEVRLGVEILRQVT